MMRSKRFSWPSGHSTESSKELEIYWDAATEFGEKWRPVILIIQLQEIMDNLVAGITQSVAVEVYNMKLDSK